MDDVARHERTVGRYALFGEIGAGGMASVHFGRRLGPAGFSRLVAVKRLHPHLLADRHFSQAFFDEARIAARVSHPNVVSIHDVVMQGEEALLVMEYVHGVALSKLVEAEARAGSAVPTPIAIAVAVDVLHGLHAAHEARDEGGRPLDVVHRDVSPQNVLVGVDGVARVLDFGIAKAARRMQTTASGTIKGKLAYLAPERFDDAEDTRAVDVFGAGIVVWEMLAGESYFWAQTDSALMKQVVACAYRPLPARETDPVHAQLDAVLARALAKDPAARWPSAMELATALEAIQKPASRPDVTAWVRTLAGAELDRTAEVLAEIERASVPPPAPSGRGVPARAAATEATREPRTSTDAVATRAVDGEGAKDRTERRRALPLGVLGGAAAIAVVAVVGASALRAPKPLVATATAAPTVSVSAEATVDAGAPANVAVTASATASAPAKGTAAVVPRPRPRVLADAGTAPPRPPPDEAPSDRK